MWKQCYQTLRLMGNNGRRCCREEISIIGAPRANKECVCSHVHSDQSTDCIRSKLNHNWTIPKVSCKNNFILRGSNPIWPWLPPSGTRGVLVRDGNHHWLPSNHVKLSIWPWTWDSLLPPRVLLWKIKDTRRTKTSLFLHGCCPLMNPTTPLSTQTSPGTQDRTLVRRPVLPMYQPTIC